MEADENQKLQAIQMESAMLLVEAVERETCLGFTLSASGGTVDVLPWHGKPLISEMRATSGTLFEAQYLTNLIDWLDGVAYGRLHVNPASNAGM
ncbi:MAG TPA: hypothetical protein VIH30_09900 [Aquirhabdus sp.]